MSAAGQGATLVDQRTAEALRGRATLGSVRSVSLKGLAAPVTVAEVSLARRGRTAVRLGGHYAPRRSSGGAGGGGAPARRPRRCAPHRRRSRLREVAPRRRDRPPRSNPRPARSRGRVRRLWARAPAGTVRRSPAAGAGTRRALRRDRAALARRGAAGAAAQPGARTAPRGDRAHRRTRGRCASRAARKARRRPALCRPGTDSRRARGSPLGRRALAAHARGTRCAAAGIALRSRPDEPVGCHRNGIAAAGAARRRYRGDRARHVESAGRRPTCRTST